MFDLKISLATVLLLIASLQFSDTIEVATCIRYETFRAKEYEISPYKFAEKWFSHNVHVLPRIKTRIRSRQKRLFGCYEPINKPGLDVSGSCQGLCCRCPRRMACSNSDPCCGYGYLSIPRNQCAFNEKTTERTTQEVPRDNERTTTSEVTRDAETPTREGTERMESTQYFEIRSSTSTTPRIITMPTTKRITTPTTKKSTTQTTTKRLTTPTTTSTTKRLTTPTTTPKTTPTTTPTTTSTTTPKTTPATKRSTTTPTTTPKTTPTTTPTTIRSTTPKRTPKTTQIPEPATKPIEIPQVTTTTKATFEGESCGGDCGPNADCAILDNICVCSYGYEMSDGNQCLPKCEPKCQNGNCVAPNKCACWPHYEQTSNSVCELQCSPDNCHFGKCNENGTCICDHGYYRNGNACVWADDDIVSKPDDCDCWVEFGGNDLDCLQLCDGYNSKVGCIETDTCKNDGNDFLCPEKNYKCIKSRLNLYSTESAPKSQAAEITSSSNHLSVLVTAFLSIVLLVGVALLAKRRRWFTGLWSYHQMEDN